MNRLQLIFDFLIFRHCVTSDTATIVLSRCNLLQRRNIGNWKKTNMLASNPVTNYLFKKKRLNNFAVHVPTRNAPYKLCAPMYTYVGATLINYKFYVYVLWFWLTYVFVCHWYTHRYLIKSNTIFFLNTGRHPSRLGTPWMISQRDFEYQGHIKSKRSLWNIQPIRYHKRYP